MLKLNSKALKWADADRELLKGGTEIGEIAPLFAKVDEKQVEAQEAKLGAGAR
jgi:methionyl-tRNA synthetase